MPKKTVSSQKIETDKLIWFTGVHRLQYHRVRVSVSKCVHMYEHGCVSVCVSVRTDSNRM